MKTLFVLPLFWIALFGANLSYGTLPTPDESAQKLRERLSPLIEEKLEEHCGEACPGFEINPQYKIPPQRSSLDDLGFQDLKQELPQDPPVLQALRVVVLVDRSVTKQAQDTLRDIVRSTVGNQVAVPVQVDLKSLNSGSPVLSKRAFDKKEEEKVFQRNAILNMVHRLVWPLTLLVVGLLSFLALLSFLRNKRMLLKAALDAQAAKAAAEKEEREAAAAAAAKKEAESRLDANLVEKGIADLLENHGDDLRWFVEEKTRQNDVASLKKILTLFPSQRLTSKLDFSPGVFGLLASFPDQPEWSPSVELLNWMRHSVQKSHWKRLEEVKRPLSILTRLSSQNVPSIFKRLGSVGDRALFLLTIPEERWPECLTLLSSEERLQLGMAIAQYHQLSSIQKEEVEQGLVDRIRGAEQSRDAGNLSEDLEKFSLYLPEAEGEQLWNTLSSRYTQLALPSSSRSLDETFQSMNLKETLEVFTKISLASLAILLEQTNEANRKRIQSGLPKALQERLKVRLAQGLKLSDTDRMKARAEFWVEYRKFKKAGS